MLAVAPDIWRRPRLVVACVAALAITLVVVYLELPLRAGPFRAGLVYGRPDTWDGFWYVALAEQFRGSLLDPFVDLTGKVGQLGSLTYSAIRPAGVRHPGRLRGDGHAPAALRPADRARRSSITCFFAASYVNADISRYYLGPVLIAWTWLAILAGMVAESIAASLGLGGVQWAAGGRTTAASNRIALPAALIAAVMLAPTLLAIPSRLASVDESRDHLAAAWLDRVLPLLEPDAIVVSVVELFDPALVRPEGRGAPA